MGKCRWHGEFEGDLCPAIAVSTGERCRVTPNRKDDDEKGGVILADKALSLDERLEHRSFSRPETLAYLSSYFGQAADAYGAVALVRAAKTVQDGIDAAREAKSAEEYWNRILSTTIWSEPQRELISAIRNPDLKTVIAYGPVACGKTLALTAGLVGLVLEQGEQNSSIVHAVITRSRQQADITIGTAMQRWAWDAWTNLDNKQNGWTLGGYTMVKSVGAHDLSAHQIQGGDWGGVLLNEGTILPITMVDQALERCRVGYGKVLVDTNPDTPVNEFEERYVRAVEAGERSGKVVRFALVDEDSWDAEANTYTRTPCWWLPENYVADLVANYPKGTPEHDRRILGKPAFHAGMVFPQVMQALAPWDGKVPDFWLVSVDVGYSASATHAICIACTKGNDGVWKLQVAKEWRYSGRDTGQPKAFPWQVTELVSWLQDELEDHADVRLIVDEAESQWIKTLAMHFATEGIRWQLTHCPKGRIDDSIRAVHGLTDPDHGAMRIDGERCPHLVREMQSLMWDEGPAEKDRDKPTIGDDHGVAALRYASILWEQAGPGRMMPHKVVHDREVRAARAG